MANDPQGRPSAMVDELQRTSRFVAVEAQYDPDDLTGKIVAGRYRVLEKLGQGGMGSVFRAEHIEIGKQVAIKVLAAYYGQDDQQRRRFLREARAASTIGHENVVDVTDFGPAPNGSVFLAMELLVGEELSELMTREGPLPWGRTKKIILQVCRALHAAHDKGIFHRDVKPENCFRIKRGVNRDFIKVLDFGIAKILSKEINPDQSLSQAGTVFGTPEYMSPEQARGSKVDHRTDIYAVGIMLYEMLTGHVPFKGESNLEVLARQANDQPIPPSHVAPQLVTPDVEAIIMKTLQKNPDDRYQSIRELAEAIAAVMAPGELNVSGQMITTTGQSPNLDKTRERLYITIIVLLGISVIAMGIVLTIFILRQ